MLDVTKKNNPSQILGCAFDPVTETDVLQRAKDLLLSSKRGYISTVNVAILMMMRRDQRLHKFIENSAMTVADGQPIIWLSKLLKCPLPERVTGVDLCEKIATLAVETNKSIFLMGASNKILNLTEKKLLMDNPGLVIAGRCNGYFDDEEAANRVTAIQESGADILFVAMGVPRQEYFVLDNWDKMSVKLAIALGGTYDVVGGVKKRAPQWMQKNGLEWFYRLIQEPRRLAKRYAITNTQFIALSLKEIWIRKRKS